mgnify:CR=1 FL=1
MAELDKLVVKIEADLSDLKKGMKEANRSIKKSSKGIKKSMGGAAKATERLKGAMLKLGAAIAVGLAVKKVADVSAEFQDLQLTLNTVFKTAESGQAAMDFIVEFAQRTPFDIQTLTKSMIQLGGAGVKPTVKLLTTLGDAASATTNRLQTFETLTRIVTRSVGGGLGLEELEQLVSAGIPVYKMLNDEIGVSRTEISELGQSAEGAKIIMDALMTQLDKEFGGGMDKASKNLSVAFSNLGIAATQFQKSIGDEMNESLASLSNETSKFLTLIEPLGALLGIIASAFIYLGAIIMKSFNFVIVMAIKSTHALRNALADLSFGVLDFMRVDEKAVKSLAELEEMLGANVTAMDDSAAKLKVVTMAQELLNEKFADGQGLLKEMNEELARTGGQETVDQMKAIEDQTADVMKIFDSTGESISKAFGESIASGESFRQSMLDIFQSVISQVIALIVQLTIVAPMMEGIRKGVKSSQGKSVMGQIAGGLKGMIGLAGGGTVQPNTPYMVGERGKELFMPSTGGKIVPNGQLGGSGGGSIVIEQNLNFATGVSQTVRAEVMNLLPAIQESTLSAVRDARLRGGSFAKDFGG